MESQYFCMSARLVAYDALFFQTSWKSASDTFSPTPCSSAFNWLMSFPVKEMSPDLTFELRRVQLLPWMSEVAASWISEVAASWMSKVAASWMSDRCSISKHVGGVCMWGRLQAGGCACVCACMHVVE